MNKIMVFAGGTGGHVIPGLVVARLLREQGTAVQWVGTQAGIEARLVPAAGIQLHLIQVQGLRGTGLKRKIKAPWVLVKALWQAWKILKKERPEAVLSMGGFVSGPASLAARLLRIPVVVHEQNALAGTTNQIVARFATRVLSGFEHVMGLPQTEWVGNPVRQDIVDCRQNALSTPLRVLVVGGSQGALVFNQELPQMLSLIEKETALNVWHQAGKGKAEGVEKAYQSMGSEAKVSEFIDDMAAAYAWADVLLCRAGAMTVSEVAAAGVAAVFVPFPYAVGDHQTKNAEYLANNNAALLINQQQFTNDSGLTQLKGLLMQPEKIQQMANDVKKYAKPHAARSVVTVLQEVTDATLY